MTEQEAIQQLKDLDQNSPVFETHEKADEILCALLSANGYQEVVKEYNKIERHFD